MADRKTKKETKPRVWHEADLIKAFGLKRITEYQTPLMKEWLDVAMPIFDANEQKNFDKNLKKAIKGIAGWSEEDLKIKFIGNILDLGGLGEDDIVLGYFDKIITGTVEGIKLTVKSDFMLAKGILNIHEEPYFHFQEYKPHLNPTGESMAQLIEAFLIAQSKNQKPRPMYGAEIIGKQWVFVVMEGKEYCISNLFDCTDREDLMKIIAVLRKFKYILETRLLS